MARSSLAKHKQKTKEFPRLCPHCRSSRLEVIDRKGSFNGKETKERGFYCIACKYLNIRRFIVTEVTGDEPAGTA